MLTEWLPPLAATCAAASSVFSYVAVRYVARQTRAQVILDCMRSYTNIRRLRTDATEHHSVDRARDYYRELFDLHWTEYELYRERLIPRRMYVAWLDARRRNFREDGIEIQLPNAQCQRVTYAECWHKLVNDNYFSPADGFVAFMQLVHDNNVDAAIRGIK